MPEQTVTLTEMLGDIRRRARFVVAVVVAAAGLAFGLSHLQPTRYEATSSLLFSEPESYAPDRVAATNLALATLDTVLVRVQREVSPEFTVDELRSRVSIAPKGQADIVEVRAKGDDPEQAARLADDVAQQIVEVRIQRARAVRARTMAAIRRQIAAEPRTSGVREPLLRRQRALIVEQAAEDGDVAIAEMAFAPRDRSQPKPLRNAAVGGGAGLLLALLVVLALRDRGRELTDEQVTALAGDSRVLARVPEGGDGWRQEAFLEGIQFLRISVFGGLGRDQGPHVVVITSPRPDDGKSTVAEHLARALAETGRTVALVDADLRRGVLASRLGVSADEGLAQALAAGRPPELRETGVDRLFLVPHGQRTDETIARVDTTSVRRLLDGLRTTVDVVLVDTAPVCVAAETSDIAAAADGVVLVVHADGDDPGSIRLAHAQLASVDADVLGVVMNRTATVRRDRSAYQAYGVRTRSRTRSADSSNRA